MLFPEDAHPVVHRNCNDKRSFTILISTYYHSNHDDVKTILLITLITFLANPRGERSLGQPLWIALSVAVLSGII